MNRYVAFLNALTTATATIDYDAAEVVSPRFEAILNQDVYVSLWYYTGAGVVLFDVQLRALKSDSNFIEDAPDLGDTLGYWSFNTCDAALAAINGLMIATIDRDEP